MKILSLNLILILAILPVLSSCDIARRIEEKSARVNQYENVALRLAKENRELKVKISQLDYEIQQLKAEKKFLDLKLRDKTLGRGIASVATPKYVVPKNDLVKFGTYKWTPGQLLAVAENSFEKKDYEKSAQFFQAMLANFPKSKKVNDRVLFQAGVSAYETGKHYDWTLGNLEQLVSMYPASQYYRGAKLWLALTNLKLGNTDKFYNTVEEFRKKYRNTPEWKILRSHYEEIITKYKK